jgi:hypothetical protein
MEGDTLWLTQVQIANSDKPVMFYNLDVILAIGYRVKSQRGIQFRQGIALGEVGSAA